MLMQRFLGVDIILLTDCASLLDSASSVAILNI